jgi:hypothetical protein
MRWAEILECQRGLVSVLERQVFELDVQANFKMPPKLPHFAALLEQETAALRAMGSVLIAGAYLPIAPTGTHN